MGLIRIIKYRRLLNARKRHYASLALSLAMAHASFGTVKYKSLGNGLIDISLNLHDDLNFKLDVANNLEQKKYQMKGKWGLENGDYVLQFKRSKKDIKSLFSGKSGFQAYANIEDDKTVKFPVSRVGIMIEGVYCLRALS